MTSIRLIENKQNDRNTTDVASILVRLVLLCAIDAFLIWFALRAFSDGYIALTIAVVALGLFINFVILYNDVYPLRWMLMGLVLLVMFSIYPIILTVITAFTNYGDGHLLTKQQSIEIVLSQRYLPEGGSAYTWTGYQNSDGDYALWLQDPDGNSFFAVPGEPLVPSADVSGASDFDDKGIPDAVGGYERLNALLVAANRDIPTIQFGTELDGVQIRSPQEASQLQPAFSYDADTDTLIRAEDGMVFEPIVGKWTASNGEELLQGFQDQIGFDNFNRFFNSPAFRGPLVRIISWNFAFALISVVSTFALGLAIAYIFNDPKFPGRKIIQSFLLIPYTIPSLITILIWRGMFNPQVGVINRTLSDWFGANPSWFQDPWLAKLAILIVNLWLGYPYFMLICSGALQAIPQDIYAAAEVDGASAWQRFSKITLPLLLVAVGPLLVASFTYNFNNFNLIFLFIEGGPPIAGAATRAGHTDILISYVYNLAFAAGRGKEYGLGSAITIVIFAIVAVITLFQFRYTQMWEEVGENA